MRHSIEVSRPTLRWCTANLSILTCSAVVWAHEVMHFQDIGKAVAGWDVYIIDQPVKGWPGVPFQPGNDLINRGAYGDLFTKHLAFNDAHLDTDAADNADNYAYFFLANWLIRKKDYYAHRRAVQVNPTKPPAEADDNGRSAAHPRDEDDPFDYEHYCYGLFEGEG